MNSKLTLNVEEEVTRKAKVYARSRGKSLSKVVEQYLRFITESEQPSPVISDRVTSTADELELPHGVGVDDVRLRYLLEKHFGPQDID